MNRTWIRLWCAVAAMAALAGAAERRAENVIFVMTDVLRWQEVFNGAEAALIDKDRGGVGDVEALRKAF